MIEVCGVDGAGKTTLISLTRGILRSDSGTRAYERAVRSESRNFMDMLGMHLGIDVPQRDFDLALTLDTARAAVADFVAYRARPHYHALVTHYRCDLVARLQVHGVADDDIVTAIAASIAEPDLAVLLEVPEDVALARITSRPQQDDVIRLANPREAIAAQAYELRRAFGAARCPTIALDGTQPAGELASEVAAKVLSLVDGSDIY